MEENLKKIKEKVEAQIGQIKDLKGLDEIKNEVLGRKGELTQILKNLKNYEEKERPKIGKIVNEA